MRLLPEPAKRLGIRGNCEHHWYNTTIGMAMLIGRFDDHLMLAVAVPLQQTVSPSLGTFRVTPLFTVLLVSVI